LYLYLKTPYSIKFSRRKKKSATSYGDTLKGPDASL
jgi:hypothetical protein